MWSGFFSANVQERILNLQTTYRTHGLIANTKLVIDTHIPTTFAMGETTPHDRSLAEDATDDAGSDPPEEEDEDISMNFNNLRVSEEDGMPLLQ
jgi:hypothetical protein